MRRSRNATRRDISGLIVIPLALLLVLSGCGGSGGGGSNTGSNVSSGGGSGSGSGSGSGAGSGSGTGSGSGSGSGSGGGSSTFTVGGTVSGLTGTVVLQDNGGDNLSVSANGPFKFSTTLASGATYSVTILTSPTNQTCAVSSGAGTVTANVSTVAVTCTTQYTIGGTISGLTGAVVLQNNGGDNLNLSSNGPFTFPTTLASGATYSVTVLTQPTGQTCTVSNGSGTVSADVANVAVSCASQYTVGGTVTNLEAVTLVLEDNGGDDTTVLPGRSTFTFPTAVANGTSYKVTIKTQPNGESCSLTQGTGTLSGADVNSVSVSCSAVAQWAWMSGDDSTNAPVYGTEGQGSSANTPGSRGYAATSVDAAGNLWLFGGFNCTSGDCSTGNYMADLWSYGTKTGQWTWVGGSDTPNLAGTYGTQGSSAATNLPGGRSGAAVWTDSAGNIWVFGGQGYDSAGTLGYLNDLWKYDSSTSQWTWVNGSSLANQAGVYGTLGVPAAANQPGGRQGGVTWIDGSNDLWLEGGFGLDASGTTGFLSDLWKFDPSTEQWTWVNGPSSGDQPGVYGTQGVAASANVPGARENATGWADRSGGLWMFGGNGLGSSVSAASGELNDLWRYDTTTGLWTWMGGSSTTNALGVYGTQGVGSASNVPGSRFSASSWVDSSGVFWMFGGYGYDTVSAQSNVQNDLWKYDPIAQVWTWVAGNADGGGNSGVYDVQGLPGPQNLPGARQAAMTWTDPTGSVWMYAGDGASPAQLNDTTFTLGSADDLWRLGTSTFYNGTGTMTGTFVDGSGCQYTVQSNILNANVTLGAPSAGALTIYFTTTFTKKASDAASCPGYIDARSVSIPITISDTSVQSRSGSVGPVSATLSGSTISGTVGYQASGPQGSGTATWNDSGNFTATLSPAQ